MSLKLKPRKLKRTVTIKDVPSEYADVFNAFCSNADDEDSKTRTEVFCEMVHNELSKRCGSEENATEQFRIDRQRTAEWNTHVANALYQQLKNNG